MNQFLSIKEQIIKCIDDAEVHISDPRNDGKHLEAIVISKQFEGAPLIKQHRMVMSALKEQFKSSLHALILKTYTPLEWQQCKKC